MTTYLVELLGLAFWQIIFSASFFFGLIFFIFVILGAFGNEESDLHDSEIDTDGIPDDANLIDLDGDGIPDGWDIDGDGVPDLELQAELDFDVESGSLIDIDGDCIPDGDGIPDVDTEGYSMSTDTDLDTDVDFDGNIGDFENVELDKSWDVSPVKYREYKSNYKMGNVSIFLFFFGQVGVISGKNLQDIHILIALIVGYVTMKGFSWFIANYTKTIIVPIQDIKRGDVAIVIYGITPEKVGMAQVYRKDDIISTIVAKGAFPHDFFSKNEKGYIWSKENEIYTITRGIVGQPDLKYSSKITKKKALDL